jgi:SAM-dependent methyltransferase
MSNQQLSPLVRRDSSFDVQRWSENYRDAQQPRIDWLADRVAEHHTGGPVVELGSHPHVLQLRLDEDQPTVGVDLDPTRASAEVRDELDIRQCDLDEDRVPVGSGQAGTVVCSEVLEHLARPERALAEMERILKPGGRGIVTTPNFGRLETRARALRGRNPHRLDSEIALADEVGHEGHRQLLTTDELAGLADHVGLRVVEQGTVQFWPARSRLLDALYRVWPAVRPFQYAIVEPYK